MMQPQRSLDDKYSDSMNAPTVWVHTEVVTIGGYDYRRDEIFVGDELARVEFPYAAFPNPNDDSYSLLTLAVQVTFIATSSTFVGYAIGALFA